MMLRPAALLFVLTACLVASAPAQTVREDFWETNGDVLTMALSPSGKTLYIGGWFTYVGPRTGCGAVLDAETGDARVPRDKAEGTVYAAVSDGAGGWFVGGSFISVGLESRTGLAHFTREGTLSSWNPDTDGPVYALMRNGSTLYVGGAFTSVNGTARNRVAALDVVGRSVTEWNPDANGIVRTMATHDSTVYLGGEFTSVGGRMRERLVAIHERTGVPTDLIVSVNGPVLALVVGDAMVYVGGAFGNMAGLVRNGIASVDRATGEITTWNPGDFHPMYRHYNRITALALGEATVYVGGDFQYFGGQDRYRLAEVDGTTGLATEWNPDVNHGYGGAVLALARTESVMYLGGAFGAVGNDGRAWLASVDLQTGSATAWNPSLSGAVRAVALDGDAVYAGGDFTSAGGVQRARIAAIDVLTGKATDWNPESNSVIASLAAGETRVYAGGGFTRIGDADRYRVAALDVMTGKATPWDPDPRMIYEGYNPGPPSGVYSVVMNGSSVFVGGLYNRIGGQDRVNLAELDGENGVVTAWKQDDRDPVGDGHTILITDSRLFAAGGMVGALDTVTGSPYWKSAPSNAASIGSLALFGSVLYVGGDFLWQLGVDHYAGDGLVTLDAGTGALMDSTFDVEGSVSVMAIDGPTLYVAGSLTKIRGEDRHGLAALDAATGAVTAWDPGPMLSGAGGYFFVSCLALDKGVVYAGGRFSGVGSVRKSNLVAIAGEGAPVEPFPRPLAAYPNYPNPFRAATTIQFDLPDPTPVRLRVYDLQGRPVRTLLDGESAAPGRHYVSWQGDDDQGRPVASGIYFSRLEAGTLRDVRRMVRLNGPTD